MSARIKGFLASLIDFVLEIDPKYIIISLLSMYPPIQNIILPPPPGATAKDYEIPLYMYFVVAFAVSFWLFIRRRHLKYVERSRYGISHILAQNQVNEMENVLEFMSEFEAELEKIDSKVHQQHNGYPVNLEADLQKLSSLCNKLN